MFNVLRSGQNVFQSSCTILHFHTQCMSVPISPPPHQHLLSIFFILAILVGVNWHLIVVLSWISLKADDIELFLCAYWLHIFCWEMHIQILNLFLNWIICLFCCWVVRVLYIFWIWAPYWIYDLQIVSLIFCFIKYLFNIKEDNYVILFNLFIW